MTRRLNRMNKIFLFQANAFQMQPISIFFVKTFFVFWLAVFSVWTIIAHIAQIWGLTFHNVCFYFSILICPLIYMFIKSSLSSYRASTSEPDDYERHTFILLFFLALIGGILAVGAIRPDYDDVDYISRAVYFLNAPHEPLDLLKHDHALLQAPFYWALNIFYTIELFCAYIAYIFRLPFLHVYHILLPALGGIMLPLAWFLAFSKFSNKTIGATLAAAAVCVFFSLDGEPHRSFGNFAFVRIWQGKAILMSIGIPLFIKFSLDFFNNPTITYWCQLFMLLITTSGLSAMSSYFMPFLGVIIGLSYCYSQGFKTKEYLKKLIVLFPAYIYLCMIVCYFLLHFNKTTIDQIGFQFVTNQQWPETFVGHFKFVFIEILSYPSFVFMFFTILSLMVAGRKEGRFIFAWMFLSIILFLNPLVFPIISRYATTLNHYWRLFYLLPFPFVVGYPMTFFAWRFSFKPQWSYLIFLGMLSIAIIGNLWPPQKYAPLVTFGKLPFALGKYKIDPILETDIQQIIAVSSPGPMLAPENYSAFIPRYSANFPQVIVRKYMLMGYAITHGCLEETEMKFNAVDYISGQSETGQEDAMAVIKNVISNIVVSSFVIKQKNWEKFAKILEENAFQFVMQNDRILLYSRDKSEVWISD